MLCWALIATSNDFVMEVCTPHAFYDQLHREHASWHLHHTLPCLNAIVSYSIDYAGSYPKISNTRRTLVGNKIVDHSDVVGASPVGAAPTTSLFST